MANPTPILKGIAGLLSKPKVAAGTSAALYMLAPDDIQAGGLMQAIKAAKIARQRLADEIAARFSDAPSSSIEQRKAEARLREMDQKIEAMQKQLEDAPKNLEWGPTPGAMRIQEMMDRYGDVKQGMGTPPAQMELRLDMPRLGPLQELDESIKRDALRETKKQWAEQTEMDAVKKRLEDFDVDDWRKQKDWINETTTLEERRRLMEALHRRDEMNDKYNWD
jgi:hypothetical protein